MFSFVHCPPFKIPIEFVGVALTALKLIVIYIQSVYSKEDSDRNFVNK